MAFVFTVTSVTWTTPAGAAPAEIASAAVLPIDSLAIPAEMGTITRSRMAEGGGRMTKDEKSAPSSILPPPSENFVILIQDAHAVIDAQENIAKILGVLQKKYGVRLTALEGAKGRLEPVLLRTFPEPDAKRKVLAGYEKRAELSGPEVASVLQEESGEFRGMEDWGLYERNYSAYLGAQANKDSLRDEWSRFKQTLDSERAKVYDAKLNEFEEIRENFFTERASLLDLLIYLSKFKGLLNETSQAVNSKIKPPPFEKGDKGGFEENLQKSPLPPLSERGGPSRERDGVRDDPYQELPGLIATIGYEKSGKQEALVPLVRKIADEFKVKYLRGLGVKTEMNFYNRYQAFMTGQITAGQMLQYLVQVGSENGKTIELTPALKKLLGHAELLSEIQGSRLSDELQSFLLEVESSLIKTTAQREMAEKYQKLLLLKAMIELELTHEDLAKYQKDPDAYLSLMTDSAFMQGLAPALEFYRVALERDRAFMTKIDAMMKDSKQKTVAVVSGGFHTNGLERILRENKVPYVIVTPKISSLEGSENYDKVMKGDVSFKDDLKTTYFDALMRHASKALVGMLPIHDRVKTLKVWRDNVIRELAREGRIADAGKYLPYIDEILQNMPEAVNAVGPKRTQEELLGIIQKELEKFKKDSLERIWKTFEFQLGIFTDGLKQLVAQKELSTRSVFALLNRASQSKPSFMNIPQFLDPNGFKGPPVAYREQPMSSPIVPVTAGTAMVPAITTPVKAAEIVPAVLPVVGEFAGRSESRAAKIVATVMLVGALTFSSMFGSGISAAMAAGANAAAVVSIPWDVKKILSQGVNQQQTLRRASLEEKVLKRDGKEATIDKVSKDLTRIIDEIYAELPGEERIAMHNLALYIIELESKFQEVVQKDHRGRPVFIAFGLGQTEWRTASDHFLNFLKYEPRSESPDYKIRKAERDAIAKRLGLSSGDAIGRLVKMSGRVGKNALGHALANAIAGDRELDLRIVLVTLSRNLKAVQSGIKRVPGGQNTFVKFDTLEGRPIFYKLYRGPRYTLLARLQRAEEELEDDFKVFTLPQETVEGGEVVASADAGGLFAFGFRTKLGIVILLGLGAGAATASILFKVTQPKAHKSRKGRAPKQIPAKKRVPSGYVLRTDPKTKKTIAVRRSEIRKVSEEDSPEALRRAKFEIPGTIIAKPDLLGTVVDVKAMPPEVWKKLAKVLVNLERERFRIGDPSYPERRMYEWLQGFGAPKRSIHLLINPQGEIVGVTDARRFTTTATLDLLMTREDKVWGKGLKLMHWLLGLMYGYGVKRVRWSSTSAAVPFYEKKLIPSLRKAKIIGESVKYKNGYPDPKGRYGEKFSKEESDPKEKLTSIAFEVSIIDNALDDKFSSLRKSWGKQRSEIRDDEEMPEIFVQDPSAIQRRGEILNKRGEIFDDVFLRAQEKRLVKELLQDPRRWRIQEQDEDRAAYGESVSNMSSSQLGDETRRLLMGEVVPLNALDLLKFTGEEFLEGFVGHLSEFGMLNHYVGHTRPTEIFLAAVGSKPEEDRQEMLLELDKFAIVLREIAMRWSLSAVRVPFRMPEEAVAEHPQFGDSFKVDPEKLDPAQVEQLAEAIVELFWQSFPAVRGEAEYARGVLQWEKRIRNPKRELYVLINSSGELMGVIDGVLVKERKRKSAFIETLMSRKDEIRGKGNYLMDLFIRESLRRGVGNVSWAPSNLSREFYRKYIETRERAGILKLSQDNSRTYGVKPLSDPLSPKFMDPQYDYLRPSAKGRSESRVMGEEWGDDALSVKFRGFLSDPKNPRYVDPRTGGVAVDTKLFLDSLAEADRAAITRSLAESVYAIDPVTGVKDEKQSEMLKDAGIQRRLALLNEPEFKARSKRLFLYLDGSGRPVGRADLAFSENGKKAELTALVVAKPHRAQPERGIKGKGVGAFLLQVALDEAEKENSETFEIAYLLEAKNFYLKYLSENFGITFEGNETAKTVNGFLVTLAPTITFPLELVRLTSPKLSVNPVEVSEAGLEARSEVRKQFMLGFEMPGSPVAEHSRFGKVYIVDREELKKAPSRWERVTQTILEVVRSRTPSGAESEQEWKKWLEDPRQDFLLMVNSDQEVSGIVRGSVVEGVGFIHSIVTLNGGERYAGWYLTDAFARNMSNKGIARTGWIASPALKDYFEQYIQTRQKAEIIAAVEKTGVSYSFDLRADPLGSKFIASKYDYLYPAGEGRSEAREPREEESFDASLSSPSFWRLVRDGVSAFWDKISGRTPVEEVMSEQPEPVVSESNVNSVLSDFVGKGGRREELVYKFDPKLSAEDGKLSFLRVTNSIIEKIPVDLATKLVSRFNILRICLGEVFLNAYDAIDGYYSDEYLEYLLKEKKVSIKRPLGYSGKVSVSFEIKNDNLVIAVIDNGMGENAPDTQYKAAHRGEFFGSGGAGIYAVRDFLDPIGGKFELVVDRSQTKATLTIPFSGLKLKSDQAESIDLPRGTDAAVARTERPVIQEEVPEEGPEGRSEVRFKIPPNAIIAEYPAFGTVVDMSRVNLTERQLQRTAAELFEIAKVAFPPKKGEEPREKDSSGWVERLRDPDRNVYVLVSPAGKIVGATVSYPPMDDDGALLELIMARKDGVRGRGAFLLDSFLSSMFRSKMYRENSEKKVVWASVNAAKEFYENDEAGYLNAREEAGVLKFRTVRDSHEVVLSADPLDSKFISLRAFWGSPRPEVPSAVVVPTEAEQKALSDALAALKQKFLLQRDNAHDVANQLAIFNVNLELFYRENPAQLKEYKDKYDVLQKTFGDFQAEVRANALDAITTLEAVESRSDKVDGALADFTRMFEEVKRSLPAEPEKAKDEQDEILKSAWGAAGAVESLLSENSGNLRLNEISLIDELGRALGIYEARFESSFKIEFDKTGLSEANVMGNSNAIKRIILNLLTNSRKAFESDPLPVEDRLVKLTLSAEGDNYVMKYENNGRPIDTEGDKPIDRIFNRGETTKIGDGLGLAICRELVKAMGNGTMTVKNKADGKGVIFTITLSKEPAKASAPTPDSPGVGKIAIPASAAPDSSDVGPIARSEMRFNGLMKVVSSDEVMAKTEAEGVDAVRSGLMERGRVAVGQAELGKTIDERIAQLREELGKYNTAQDVISFVLSPGFEERLSALLGEFGDVTELVSQIRNRVIFGDESLSSDRLADNASELDIGKIAMDQALLDAAAVGLVMNAKEPSFTLLMDRPGNGIAEEILKMIKELKPSQLIVFNAAGVKPLGRAWQSQLKVPIMSVGNEGAVRRAVKSSIDLVVSFWTRDSGMSDLGIYSVLAEISRIADPRLRELALTAVRVAILRFATFDREMQSKILAEPAAIKSYLEQFGIPSFIQFNAKGLVFNIERLVEEYTARQTVEKAA